MVTDRLKATSVGHHVFLTLRTARYGEVLRGVSLTPDTSGSDDDDRDTDGSSER